MGLRNISVSQNNYTALKSLGKAGDSFNDVISALIKEIQSTEHPRMENSFKELRSEERPGNRTQTIASSANSDI